MDDLVDLMTLDEVAHRGCMSLSQVHELIKRGELVAIKRGRMRRVTTESYKAFIKPRPEDAVPPGKPEWLRRYA
jgi:hypothetical protein